MRVFLDTNVLVAAFATRGLCADLFRLVAVEHELIVGKPVVAELARVLADKLRMPVAARAEVLRVMRRFPLAPAAATPAALAIDDPDDEWIVACALAAGAEVFVTGDKALLRLGQVQSMPVVSPRMFWLQVTAG